MPAGAATYWWASQGGGFTLLGNDFADSTESVATVGMYNDLGLNNIIVNHGADHYASLNVLTFSNWSGYIGGMWNISGLDLNASGTTAYSIVRASSGSNTNGIYGGNIRIGQDFTTLATVNGNTKCITQLSSTTGRFNDIPTAATTANVLIDASSPAQTLTVSTTINSLKIDGAYGLDLGGTNLQITSGGLIQSGLANTSTAAGGSGGIYNGTITVGANGAASCLFLSTYSDLYIGANVQVFNTSSIKNTGIAKSGTGTLVLAGHLSVTGTVGVTQIYWYEGGLDIETNDNLTLPARTTGSGQIIMGGTGLVTMSGDARIPNTYSGGTWIKSGTIALTIPNQYNSLATLGSGAVRVDVGGCLWIQGDQAGYQANAYVLSNVTYANDFTGNGVIRVNTAQSGTGTRKTLYALGSAISPGSAGAAGAGVLTINGNLSMLASGTRYPSLAVDALHGTGTASQPIPGTDYDQLAVLGNVTNLANADLAVNIAAKKNFLGNVLTVLSTGNNLTGQALHGVSFNGTGFADITVGGTVTSGPGTVALGWVTLSNVSYPGDANRDGITDMSDYIIWFNNFGQTSTPGLTAANWQKADFNGDGITDMTDYIAWFNYFGDDQGSFAVPEPATLALLALGLPLVRRRGR